MKDKNEAEQAAEEEGSQEGVESMDTADVNINEHLNDMNTGGYQEG